METRDGGNFQTGDRVEGNVAGALGDLLDSANESPTQGPLDRVSDGIKHIWHVVYSQIQQLSRSGGRLTGQLLPTSPAPAQRPAAQHHPISFSQPVSCL